MIVICETCVTWRSVDQVLSVCGFLAQVTSIDVNCPVHAPGLATAIANECDVLSLSGLAISIGFDVSSLRGLVT